MASGFVIRKNQYYDSVFLMSVNARMLKVVGVQQTAVLMCSQANKQLLADIGVRAPDIDAALPNDLIVAVTADSQEIRYWVTWIAGWMRFRKKLPPQNCIPWKMV